VKISVGTSSNTANIHHKDNTYRWGGKTALGREHPDKEGNYYDDWNTLVDGSNSSNSGNGLCGFTDWRVPTLRELQSIVDFSQTDLNIDSDYFPNTPSEPFWSASPSVEKDFRSPRVESAWFINFIFGNFSFKIRENSYRVRLVRSDFLTTEGGQVVPSAVGSQTIKTYIPNEWHDNRYTVHHNGTVTDNNTGLMWKVCSEGQSWSKQSDNTASCSGSARGTNWKASLELVNNYTFPASDGYSDWRLPNIQELASLLALDRSNPSINSTIFPNTSKSRYNNSSPFAHDDVNNRLVTFGFSSGLSEDPARESRRYIRLVRLGR
jgi:hypothetical protein